jgi:endonuclease III
MKKDHQRNGTTQIDRGTNQIGMDEKEAKRVFEHCAMLCEVFGGDLKERCLEKGMSERLFEKFFKEGQRLTKFFDEEEKH